MPNPIPSSGTILGRGRTQRGSRTASHCPSRLVSFPGSDIPCWKQERNACCTSACPATANGTGAVPQRESKIASALASLSPGSDSHHGAGGQPWYDFGLSFLQMEIYEADYKTEERDWRRITGENVKLRQEDNGMRQQVALLEEQVRLPHLQPEKHAPGRA